MVAGLGVAALFLLLFSGAMAVGRLNAQVKKNLLTAHPQASAVFVDLPGKLEALARADLQDATAPVLTGDWTDDRACRLLSERLQEVGWVVRVRYVRRSSDARFEISCRYRQPFAFVQKGSRFYLITKEGVRLPGLYRYNSTWRIVQGVREEPPPPGSEWPGGDVQAGLATLRALPPEPITEQITAVIVDNYSGRVDPKLSPIVLATDRAGGRIVWGSPPGAEIEENSIAQKLAILRENFRHTGRVDAGYPVIDISTFPDRFTIPG